MRKDKIIKWNLQNGGYAMAHNTLHEAIDGLKLNETGTCLLHALADIGRLTELRCAAAGCTRTRFRAGGRAPDSPAVAKLDPSGPMRLENLCLMHFGCVSSRARGGKKRRPGSPQEYTDLRAIDPVDARMDAIAAATRRRVEEWKCTTHPPDSERIAAAALEREHGAARQRRLGPKPLQGIIRRAIEEVDEHCVAVPLETLPDDVLAEVLGRAG